MNTDFFKQGKASCYQLGWKPERAIWGQSCWELPFADGRIRRLLWGAGSGRSSASFRNPDNFILLHAALVDAMVLSHARI